MKYISILCYFDIYTTYDITANITIDRRNKWSTIYPIQYGYSSRIKKKKYFLIAPMSQISLLMVIIVIITVITILFMYLKSCEYNIIYQNELQMHNLS